MTQQEKLQHLNEDKGLIYYIALKYYRKYGLEKEDAVQYCYLAYWTGLDIWDPEKGPLSAFMGTRLQQRLRMDGKQERAIKGTSLLSVPVVNEADGFDTGVLRDDRTPEHEFFSKTFIHDIIAKATSRFSSRDQTIVTDYYICGNTLDDLATRHGISRQRVQQIIRRARERVKEKLGL